MATIARQPSDTISFQGEEGTCYGHTVARVFSRLIKVNFTKYFIIQDEKCSRYYSSIECKNIFECFANEQVKHKSYIPNAACTTILDDDGQIKENFSALLYSYIYKMVTAQQGCSDKGGYIDKAFQLVIEHFSDTRSIKYEDVINTLIPENPDYINKSDFRRYFETLIYKLVRIINYVKEKVKNDKIMFIVDLPINRTHFDYAKFKDMLDILQSGKYYAALGIYNPLSEPIGHAVTLSKVETAFNQSKDLFITLVIKNSWGSQANWEVNGEYLIKDNKVFLNELSESILVGCSYVYFESDTAAGKKAAAERAAAEKKAAEEAMKKAAAEKKASEEAMKKAAAEKKAAEEAMKKAEKDKIQVENYRHWSETVDRHTKEFNANRRPIEPFNLFPNLLPRVDPPPEADKIRALIVQARSGSQEDKENAMIALAGLAKYDENNIYIADAGGIPVLVELLKSRNAKLQDSAADVLLNMIRNVDLLKTISTNTSIGNITDILRSAKNAKVREIAMVMLLNRTTNDDDLNRISELAIPLLIKLASSDIEKEQDMALHVLANIAKNVNNNIASADNAINVLVARLASGTDVGKVMAAKTLQHIALNDDNKVPIANTINCIPALIILASSGNDAGTEAALKTLWNLANNEQNQKTIATAGAIPVLINIVKEGNDVVKPIAAGVLGILADKNAANQISIATKGAIPVLIELATSNNLKGQKLAAKALQSLSENDDIKASIVNSGYDIKGGKIRKNQKSKKSKKSKKTKKSGKIKTRKGRK